MAAEFDNASAPRNDTDAVRKRQSARAPEPSAFVVPEPRERADREPAARPAMRASRLSSTDTLALWKDVTVASVAGEMPDLSARQMAVLLCVYLEVGPHTVRSLAAKLNVTKAVISRAIDRLKSYGYVVRADDPRDKRSIVLRRTPDGINFLRQFGDIILDQLPDSMRR